MTWFGPPPGGYQRNQTCRPPAEGRWKAVYACGCGYVSRHRAEAPAECYRHDEERQEFLHLHASAPCGWTRP